MLRTAHNQRTDVRRPVEQLLVWQEAVDPGDVDQPEAEHGNTGGG